MSKPSGDYIAGFVDGEGCFALKFRRDIRYERKGRPTYFYWDVEFTIMLRGDDREILEMIQNTLGCGRLTENQRGMVRFSVQRIEDLHGIIIPFFEKYRLFAKKKHDFNLWKEAVNIFRENQKTTTNVEKGTRGFRKTEWRSGSLERLLTIQKAMKKYKSRQQRDWKWIAAASGS